MSWKEFYILWSQEILLTINEHVNQFLEYICYLKSIETYFWEISNYRIPFFES